MNQGRFKQNPKHLPPKWDEPALHRAARVGDHDSIQRLAKEGGNINQPFNIRLDPGARVMLATPLMMAAGSGDGASLNTMRLLLKLGADPLLDLGCGSVAWFAAAGLGWNYIPGGDVARLRMCLDLGCSPTETDCREVSLLAAAAATSDTDRVRVLLDAGANPNFANTDEPSSVSEIQDSLFNNKLAYSFQIPLHNAVEQDNIEMVRVLIEAGADVHAVDHSERTAIFPTKSSAIARLLIDAGLDIESQDDLGWTPLVAAIHDGEPEGVLALLDAGANANATHDQGFTVFMSAVACAERSLEIMNLLVQAGANPRAVSDLGWNAFHAAIDVNGLDANTEESIFSTFALLIQLGVDINHKDNYAVTPLGRARQCGTEDEEKALLELGAED